MNRGDEDQLERRVIRHVHGELTEAEAAELDRAMLTDPALRALHLSYARLDGLTADALCSVMESGSPLAVVAPPLCEQRVTQRRSWLRSRWTLPIAVAASLAVAMLIPVGSEDPADHSGYRDVGVVAHRPVMPAPTATRFERPLTHLVGTGPSAAQRNTARDVLAVMGEDGRTIYVIEVERTQVTRVLSEGTRSRVVGNDY